MPLYPFNKLFSGRFPKPRLLYDELEELDRKIQDGADAVPIVKSDVKLTKTALTKAFGKNFNNVGVVHNEEGSYLILADDKGNFKHIALEDL